MKWNAGINKIPFDTCILLYMHIRNDESYTLYSGFKSKDKDLGFLIFYNMECDGGCCRKCEGQYLTPQESHEMIKYWIPLSELEATLPKEDK